MQGVRPDEGESEVSAQRGETVVLVPYTSTPGANNQSLNPLTKTLLETYVPPEIPIVWREINPTHLLRYAEILCEMWLWPGTTILVEHDIGITKHTIRRFMDCDQPWCGHAYPIGAQSIMALGCVKFSAHLKAMQPGLMERARVNESSLDGGLVAEGDWRRMDGNVASQLHRLGHTQHQHFPDVAHFHGYPG